MATVAQQRMCMMMAATDPYSVNPAVDRAVGVGRQWICGFNR